MSITINDLYLLNTAMAENNGTSNGKDQEIQTAKGENIRIHNDLSRYD